MLDLNVDCSVYFEGYKITWKLLLEVSIHSVV